MHLTYRFKQDQEEILRAKAEFVHRLEERGSREAESRAFTPGTKSKVVRGRRKLGEPEMQNPTEVRSKKLRREKSVDAGRRVRVKK